VKKKRAFEPVVLLLLLLLLLFVVYARVASWFIAIVHICRGFTRIYYYIITLHASRLLLQHGFLLLGMLTFSTTDGTTFISIALKAARIWHHEHVFKILAIRFRDTLFRVYMSNGLSVTYIYIVSI